jgi:heme oxygenase (biliverdin-IX-beta and delta-forming)
MFTRDDLRDNTTMDPRRLREETRSEHEATEALMPLSGEVFPREIYVRTLETLLPLVESWERWAEAAAAAGLRPLLAARHRSHLLRSDLEHLQGSTAGNPPVPDWDSVLHAGGADPSPGARDAGFLGALYVMEGSTLGGQFLARHVEQVLGLTPGQGNAYFQGHGEATGAMWREVTEQIAGVPDALAPVVIEAARRTFALYGRALAAGVAAQETVHG